jgi:hypothetical protein
VVLLGVAWNAAFEAVPDGATDLVSDLDLFINDLKTEIRERAEVEMNFGGVSDDNGLMSLGSARVFPQNDEPDDINLAVASRGQYDGTGEAGTALDTEEVGASTSDIGAGRLWADLDGLDGLAGTLDDNQLNIWDETADAFVPVKAVNVSGGVGTNLIFNGSWELTDGTGDETVSGACTVLGTSPCPVGWAPVTTPDVAYADVAVSEGVGLALQVDSTGAGNEGVSQTLAGLKALTTYVVRVRANATAGDVCNINVDDGTTDNTVSTQTTAVYELLETTITTTATPDDVVVSLRATGVGDICFFDHVTVYEQDPEVASPGYMISNFSASVDQSIGSSSCDILWREGTTDGVVALTVPGPGYMIRADAVSNATGTSGAAGGRGSLRLQQQIDGGGFVEVQRSWYWTEGGSNTFGDSMSIVGHIVMEPTAGSLYEYQLEWCTSNDSLTVNGLSGTTNLVASLIPIR